MVNTVEEDKTEPGRLAVNANEPPEVVLEWAL